MNKINTKPLVSICVPVFNGGSFLHRVLESCLGQTYQNIEVIVVDNVSTDNTQEVVLRYVKKDNRIKYFRNNEPLRIGDNFFKSFKLATGEFIQHIGHDDWISRDYIESSVYFFERNPKIGAVMHRTMALNMIGDKFIFNIDNNFEEKIYDIDFLLKRIVETNIAGLMIYSTMRKSEVLASEEFLKFLYEDEKFGEFYKDLQATDWPIFLRAVFKYRSFVFTQKGVFLKVDHLKNEGKFFGLEARSPAGIFRFNSLVRNCVGHIYKKLYPEYLDRLLVSFGAETISSIILAAIKSFNLFYFADFNFSDLKNFFKSYTFSQKTRTIFFSAVFLIKRPIYFIFRRISNIFVKTKDDKFLQNLFLDRDGNFII